MITQTIQESVKILKEGGVILHPTDTIWGYDEGCLSMPDLNDIVIRKKNIEIEYMDEKFDLIKEKISGMEARVIQHEYDHLKGVLFTDHLSAKRKNIINRKLNAIKKGKFQKRYNVELLKK